jgi:GDP-L-fucose synthase
MKILITGATGFLGTALVRELEKLDHELVCLNSRNCDLIDQTSLSKFNDKKYDQIYHLAAWTQAGDFCLRHAGEQWIINQKINTNVLAWWCDSQAQAKMICMGTSCSYDPNLDLVEDNYLTGKPIDSLFTYAMTKRMLYSGLLALHQQFGLQYLCLVPSTLYGSGYHTDGRQMHFIFDLMRKIIRGKEFGEPVILWGDGNQKRELVYVDDFVKIMTQLAEDVSNELINIGAGGEFSIKHFARLICWIVGYEFDRIEFDTSRYVGAKSKCLVTKKLKEKMPDLGLTPIDKGLNKTIQWFKGVPEVGENGN